MKRESYRGIKKEKTGEKEKKRSKRKANLEEGEGVNW